MKKIFRVTLNLPVTIEVYGNNDHGEVEITDVRDVSLPSVSDVHDSCTGDNLAAIDEAFADSETQCL